MTQEFRRRAVLLAAQKFADACKRLEVHVVGRPDGHSDHWPERYIRSFDKRLAEVEVAKNRLLEIAKRLK